jgi:NADPH-dependent glutamate synthase beta subunit-like oxidoreductase
MIYGIPGFKLEKEVVLRRWKQFEAGGIHFHLGTSRSAATSPSPSCAAATTPC